MRATAPTPSQRAELRRLAASPCLTPAERQQARRGQALRNEAEARALLAHLLRLAATPRVRLTVTVGAHSCTLALPVRQVEAAAVDYVQDAATDRLLPRHQTRYGGATVRRLWAN